MQYIQVISKTVGIALTMVVLTPVVHNLLGWVFSTAGGVTGEPNIPLLLVMISAQAVMLVVVFKVLDTHLPGRRGWIRGLTFGALYLLCVQVPSVFGIIAFEPGHEWELFTDARIGNHVTLLGDSVVYAIVGILIGLLFGSNADKEARSPRIPWATVAVCAVVFPLGLFGVMHLALPYLPISDPHAPVGRSLFFNLMFYGVFFMTGMGLPYIHAVARRAGGVRGLRAVLRSTGLFALIWLLVQNFMFVFGWDVSGGLVFSALSMVPVIVVLGLSELLTTRSSPAVVER